MNNQQAFEKSARHILNQGERSIGEDGDCQYRGQNGNMCALGCLIPDRKYDPTFEGRDIFDVIGGERPYGGDDPGVIVCHGMTDIPSLKNVDRALLNGLQEIHDSEKVTLWRRELKKLATSFGLNKDFLFLNKK